MLRKLLFSLFLVLTYKRGYLLLLLFTNFNIVCVLQLSDCQNYYDNRFVAHVFFALPLCKHQLHNVVYSAKTLLCSLLLAAYRQFQCSHAVLWTYVLMLWHYTPYAHKYESEPYFTISQTKRCVAPIACHFAILNKDVEIYSSQGL